MNNDELLHTGPDYEQEVNSPEGRHIAEHLRQEIDVDMGGKIKPQVEDAAIRDAVILNRRGLGDLPDDFHPEKILFHRKYTDVRFMKIYHTLPERLKINLTRAFQPLWQRDYSYRDHLPEERLEDGSRLYNVFISEGARITPM